MTAARPVSGWRATTFAVALMALTLNFLQPLAHAALMREAGPTTLWSTFCNASAADPDSQRGDSKPVAHVDHDCCLGLAHAVDLVEPSKAFTVLERASQVDLPQPSLALPTPAGIRDGPSQPRGPPSLLV
jgi:Protein of unknown function (DUF2946)